MEKVGREHLTRVKTAVLKKLSAAQIAEWITKNTLIGGAPYSFDDHEYQERVLREEAPEINMSKCSQLGISEIMGRKALALANILSPYTVAYTLPTAGFATVFTKTRIDPIIETSEELKSKVHRTNNNSEVKQFGDSFIYFRGAASSNAPISIPVDHLIHDEVDFCDQEVLGQYVSRLTHSKHRRKDRISTPTLPGFGIHRHFMESRRLHNLCKCEHCNHWFIPDYYEHVKIPYYPGELKAITRAMLSKIQWEEAALHCPSCGKVPSLAPQHREWVFENPDEKHVAVGIQITPFDAPKIITPAYLVQASTNYARVQDFINFNLGLPAENKESTFTKEDFANVFITQREGFAGAYVMGVDVGSMYHFVVGVVDGWGSVTTVLTRQVPMGQAREYYRDIKKRFPIACTVIDSGPHSETVMALQAEDQTCFASVYMKSKSIVPYTVVYKDEDEGRGQVFVRQVNVNRSKALDSYMEFVRNGALKIVEDENKDVVVAHHMSMKRVQTYDGESGELVYTWQKTDGADHFHHAHLYMWVASRIKAVGRSLVGLPVTSISSFRLRQD